MDSLSGSDIVMMVLVAIGSAAIGYAVYTMIPSLANYSWAMYAFPIVGFLVGAAVNFYFYSSKSDTSEMNIGM